MADGAPAAAAGDGGEAPAGVEGDSQDLTVFVQSLLSQMQTRFQQMSDNIIGRIDEMGGRIDELEKSIGELMQQAGVEDGAAKGAPAASEEPAKADA